MSSDGIAIRVENLSKCYPLYDAPRDRLKQFILPRLQRVVGRRPKNYYREFWALRDVSFEVTKGETLGIVGKNGSGKSTLLQILCGTLFPSEGQVEIKGRVAALLELGTGFNPEFTGRENVYLNASVLGLSKAEVDNKFDDITAFADIGEFIDQPVKTYSSGMFVRLAFAIQAHVDPDILIVDEALAVGDAYFVHRCMNRFYELKSQGTTVLLVTHDASAIRTLCSKALWLDQGCTKLFGQPAEVTDFYLAHLFGQPVASTALANRSPVLDQDNHQMGATSKNDSDGKVSILVPEAVLPNIDRRFGDQTCVIEGVGIYDEDMNRIGFCHSGSSIVLRVTIRNDSLAPDKVSLQSGYVLKNWKGEELASTNTGLEGVELPRLEMGDRVTLRYRIGLPLLHPGSYAICPTVGRRDTTGQVTVCDRVENAIVFDVVSSTTVHVLMRLPTEIVVER